MEQDRERFTKLVDELNELLDKREQELDDREAPPER
jgi:hypothetical protein